MFLLGTNCTHVIYSNYSIIPQIVKKSTHFFNFVNIIYVNLKILLNFINFTDKQQILIG